MDAASRHPVTLTVNGVPRTATVEARCSLADFLRHDLGLTGTHVGCEHGVCGACTVMVDGRSVRSCLMLAVQADGCDVLTIEGLSKDGRLSVLQQAFWENQGLQCGFCTPGMLMVSHRLLLENPAPTAEEVREAIGGNICRCTGYQDIVTSVLAATAGGKRPSPPAETDARERLVGAPIPRVEDEVVLLGRGTYVDDVKLADVLEVAFVRSPHSHARIVSVNVDRARDFPGVVYVLTGAEAAEMCPGWRGVLAFPGMKAGLQRPLALDRVRFVGEPVVAIAATSRALAEDAAELVEVEYEPLPPVVDPVEALTPGAPVVHEELGDNLSWRNQYSTGDVDGALASCDVVVSRSFRTGRHTAQAMEPRGCLASFDPVAGSLTVWLSSQAPHLMQREYASLLGLEDHRVRVITPHVGGAFGSKAHVYPDEVATCLLSMKLGRPVKWIQDRMESLPGDVAARDERVDLEMGFKSDGTLVAMRARILADGGAYSVFPRGSMTEPNMISRILPGPYRFSHYAFTAELVITNKQSLGHHRAVGHPVALFATERLMDIAARQLGLDPVEIRRRNLIRPEELPYRSAVGNTYADGRYAAAMDRLLQAVDYPGLRRWQASERARGRCVGIGLATFIEGTAPGAQFYATLGAPIMAADAVTVRMEPNGTVVALVGTAGQGQGLRTTASQVIGDTLGLRLGDITVLDGDTSMVPYGSGVWGARSAVVALGAGKLAAEAVADKVKRIAAHLLECAPEDLELGKRRVSVRGFTDRSVPLREVAAVAYFRTTALPPGIERGLEATRFYEGPAMTWINGAHLAVVEVDPRTGMVRLLSYAALDDCGRIINPLIVKGQVRGGVVHGIGGALFEHLVYDAAGQLVTGSLMDYLVPLATDVPDIEVIHMETPSSTNPNGTKGVGEAGTSGAPAAIANAVNDALSPLGAEVTVQPITPEAVLSAIEQGARRRR
ncbi:MAG: molybdopterin-dependent oxidoreductase [Candidatus Rokubacteria bacterium]|nr:molybdopterin-dependent oxidoreductase [Candidatus Rokubacteria bacterium]